MNNNALSGATVLQVAGAAGSQSFSFVAGTTISQIATAINLASDSTGVSANAITQAAVSQQAGANTYSTLGGGAVTVTAKNKGQQEGNIRVQFVSPGAGEDGQNATVDGVVNAPNATYTQVATASDAGTITVTLATTALTKAAYAWASGAGNIMTATAADGGTAGNGYTIVANAASDTGAANDLTVSLNAQTKVITINGLNSNATNQTTEAMLKTAWQGNSALNSTLQWVSGGSYAAVGHDRRREFQR